MSYNCVPVSHDKLTTFYVFRHGETDYNKKGKMQGKSNASQLTENGEQQVAQVAKRAREFLPDKDIVIVSSTLNRSVVSAIIFAGEIGYPIDQIHFEADLCEAGFGDFEGTTEEFYRNDPRFKHYKEDQFHNAMDPIKGESYQIVAKRATNAFDRLAIAFPGKTVLVFTHGGLMRSLQMYQLPPNSEPAKFNAVLNPKHEEIYNYDMISGTLKKVN